MTNGEGDLDMRLRVTNGIIGFGKIGYCTGNMVTDVFSSLFFSLVY